MSMREHNLDCSCGQPVDLVATAIAVHCPRCGRTIIQSRLADGGHSRRLAGSVLPMTRAA